MLYYQKAITQNTPLVSSTNHKEDLVIECSYGEQEKNARIITIVLHATEVYNEK